MLDRRPTQDRGPDGRMQPTAPADRAVRTRSAARARWAVARTDVERFAVAVDFARAAAAHAGRGGVDPADQLERATRAAWAAGETLLSRLAETENRDVRP